MWVGGLILLQVWKKTTTARTTVQFEVVVVGQQRMEGEVIGLTTRQKERDH